MKIELEATVPKYQQIKQMLLQEFRDEHYVAGQQLPPETELMGRFGVSRNTLRQALGELIDAGVIYAQHRKGTFFAGAPRKTAAPRTHRIGVMMPFLTVYIYPYIMQGMDDVARQQNYSLLFGTSQGKPEEEVANIQRLLDQQVDGLLIELTAVARLEDSAAFRFLATVKIPVVFMNWMLDAPGVSSVAVNDVEGARTATTHLIQAGHRRIGCIYPGTHLPGMHRCQGYRNALEAHGIPRDPRYEQALAQQGWNHAGLARAMQTLLDLGDERPTAVFFFNDEAIVYAAATLRQAHIRIPDDLSVVGFDDSPLASVLDVPLTTMTHPKYLMGKWAMMMLMEHITDAAAAYPKQLLFSPTLVERASVKPLRA